MGTHTYDDYAALPDDGRRYELIDGELLVTPSPSHAHQRVIVRLLSILEPYVESNDLGEVIVSPFDVILSKRNAPQPDIVFVERAQMRRISDRGVEGAPTLAIEVLSKSRPSLDLVKKRKIYHESGIPHYWLVDPEKRTLEGLLWQAGDYVTEAKFAGDERAVLSPFRGLEIPLGRLWLRRRP